MDFKRRKFEQSVASEIAHEIYRTLGPTMPEALAVKSDVICRVFGEAFDRHGVVTESAAERILSFVPAELAALNFRFADFNRQLTVAIRHVPAGR
jgi:hypothetical protein